MMHRQKNIKNWLFRHIQGDQKVSVHLMITIQKVTSNFILFLDRAFSLMKTKINQQNAQINSGLIYY